MRRALPSLLAAALMVAAPTAAHAADPLLSGYSGPGGGDQALLGSQLLPAGGTKAKPSLRAAAPAAAEPAAAVPAAAGTPSTPAADSPAGGTAAGSGSAAGSAAGGSGAAKSQTGAGSKTSKRAKGKAATPSSPTASAAPAARPVDAVPVRYPSKASDAGSLPISGGGIAAVLAGLALLVVLARVTAGLSRGAGQTRGA